MIGGAFTERIQREYAADRSRALILAGIVGLVLGLEACSGLGPKALKAGRPRYNVALADTDNRALLLNFVRLKYNELPYFLEVTSISSSLSLTANASVSGIKAAPRVGASGSYSERPNIIYKPLGGERFTRQLMTPIDLQTMVLLHQAGWNLDRIFRVCVASINEVRNAEPTNRPTPPRPPDFKTFLRIAEAMAELEDDGLLDLGLTVTNPESKPEVLMLIEEEGRNTPLAQQLFLDLRLDPEASVYRLTTAASGGRGDTIAIITRPLTAAMFFLSQGIEIPQSHLENGVAAVTRDDQNILFDWSEVLGSLMRIRSSEGSLPSTAFVAVRFRNAWYYIDDRDIESRTTFSFVHLLFTLQSGELPRSDVILTLPVTQ